MVACDYVVVLCPSALNEKEEFDDLAADGLYLGGQMRMQAAAKIYNDCRLKDCKLIVIGGGVKEFDEATKWRKVKDMRRFLEKNGVPRQSIVCIASEPDTSGNFRALWKEYGVELQGKTIGILTNFYHLPRAMRIAQDTQFNWNAVFVPICAEAIIIPTQSPLLNYGPQITARITAEAKGLADWERGEYIGQQKPQSDWKGELLTA